MAKNPSLKHVKAVILVGSKDFGRCPLASNLQRVLWPIGDKSVLQRLIEHISLQGINKFVICGDFEISQLSQSLDIEEHLDVTFLSESFPRGTAGGILDASESGSADELLLVFCSSMVAPPDVHLMVKAHQKARADMTIMFDPPVNGNGMTGTTAQIYVCERSVLEHIPTAGYCDIKEGLIPKLVRAGKTIHAAEIPESVGNFRTWRQYLHATTDFLEKVSSKDTVLDNYNQYGRNVWVRPDTKIATSAKILGSVMICDGVQISEDVIICGPAIIGPDSNIGKGSLVANSIIWNCGQIGENCRVQDSLLVYGARVGSGGIAKDKLIRARNGRVGNLANKTQDCLDAVSKKFQNTLQPELKNIQDKIHCRQEALSGSHSLMWLGAGIIFAVYLWAYWKPIIVDLWSIWLRNDEYSCGMLVPLISIYVLWSRRKSIMNCKITPSLWGLGALVGAQIFRFLGLFYMYSSAERLSLVLTLAALVLLLFGWRMLWKVSSVLAFMLLMLPLPKRVEAAITLPLQELATSSAVFCLEMLGYNVVKEGNVINLNGAMIAVAEACNGLRMLTAFFVITGLVVLLVNRKWWEKVIILVSSIPIGLMCNAFRLTVTAIAFTKIDMEKWEKAFHDFGGLVMMPLALGIVVFELWILSNIVIKPVLEKKKRTIIVRKVR